MIMSEHTIKKYAEMLTKGDTYELFTVLQNKYGTIAETCEKIGIERKTFYNWKHARQINLNTKIKLLRLSLEEYPIDTLEFLAKKTKTRNIEVLSYLLEVIRRIILEENKKEKLAAFSTTISRIINEYSIPPIEYLNHELYHVLELMKKKGIGIYRKMPIKYEVKYEVEMKITKTITTSATNLGEEETETKAQRAPQLTPLHGNYLVFKAITGLEE